MMISDEKIKEAYEQGWQDENDIYTGDKEPVEYPSEVENRAYSTGRWYFLAGDDMPSLDAVPWEIILKQIKYGY